MVALVALQHVHAVPGSRGCRVRWTQCRKPRATREDIEAWSAIEPGAGRLTWGKSPNVIGNRLPWPTSGRSGQGGELPPYLEMPTFTTPRTDRVVRSVPETLVSLNSLRQW